VPRCVFIINSEAENDQNYGTFWFRHDSPCEERDKEHKLHEELKERREKCEILTTKQSTILNELILSVLPNSTQKLFWRQWITFGSTDFKAKYDNCCFQIKNALNTLASKQEESLLGTFNCNKFYKLLKHRACIPPLNVNNNIIVDDNLKAEALNNYFCSVFTNDDGNEINFNSRTNFTSRNIEIDLVDKLYSKDEI
uniref:Uncharacterized protein n=1 Tax=Romanomermis culicivorax TaxID=13658 RepID=A0A915K947_ROMCU